MDLHKLREALIEGLLGCAAGIEDPEIAAHVESVARHCALSGRRGIQRHREVFMPQEFIESHTKDAAQQRGDAHHT